ncbi:MAG: cupredoxin domain-containing protein [Bacteroidota bacterium]
MRLFSLALLALAALLITGCAQEPDLALATPMDVVSGAISVPPTGFDASRPDVSRKLQTFRIDAYTEGFRPNRFQLVAGVPVRLIITRHDDDPCLATLSIPQIGLPPTDLPLGQETTVEFTPEAGGAFGFACSVDDHHRGAVLVRD